MRIASIASSVSPMAASLRIVSRRLRPASIRMRVWPAARNVVLPELLLARTQALRIRSSRASNLFYHIRATETRGNVFAARNRPKGEELG
jgi:hypothetical protein